MQQLEAVIDERTTMVCLRASGQIVPVGEPFDTLMGDLMAPPFHVHCRSVVVPWMPGFVSDTRAAANAEIARRPPKEKRFGPDGYGGRLPPPPSGPTSAPPSTPRPPLGPGGVPAAPTPAWEAAAATDPAGVHAIQKELIGDVLMEGDLTNRDFGVLSDWVTGDYEAINAALHAGRTEGIVDAYSRKYALEGFTDEMDSLFETIGFHDGDDTVVRRLTVDHEDVVALFDAEPGTSYTSRGYMSATTDPLDKIRMSGFRGNVEMEILLPEGSGGVISVPAAITYNEGEVLFQRGSTFTLAQKPVQKEDGTWLIRLLKTA